MRIFRIVVFMMFIFSIILSCSSTQTNEIVEGVGTIVYLDFEGGFFGIITDDSNYYDPINLPAQFEDDGLRVIFKAKTRLDLGSYHMWGTIVELIYIREL